MAFVMRKYGAHWCHGTCLWRTVVKFSCGDKKFSALHIHIFCLRQRRSLDVAIRFSPFVPYGQSHSILWELWVPLILMYM